MKTFGKILSVALFALMVAVSPAAKAQDGKALNIAVVDIQSLLKTSKAAQSIEAQITTMRKDFQAEVEKEEKSLRDKEKAIIAEKESLKEEELKTKVTDFQKQVAASQKKVQDRKNTLDKAIADALGKLRGEIVKIVAEIGEKKNLDLVLARTDVVIVNKDMDITPDVLTRIDAQLPSVKVN